MVLAWHQKVANGPRGLSVFKNFSPKFAEGPRGLQGFRRRERRGEFRGAGPGETYCNGRALTARLRPSPRAVRFRVGFVWI